VPLKAPRATKTNGNKNQPTATNINSKKNQRATKKTTGNPTPRQQKPTARKTNGNKTPRASMVWDGAWRYNSVGGEFPFMESPMVKGGRSGLRENADDRSKQISPYECRGGNEVGK